MIILSMAGLLGDFNKTEIRMIVKACAKFGASHDQREDGSYHLVGDVTEDNFMNFSRRYIGMAILTWRASMPQSPMSNRVLLQILEKLSRGCNGGMEHVELTASQTHFLVKAVQYHLDNDPFYKKDKIRINTLDDIRERYSITRIIHSIIGTYANYLAEKEEESQALADAYRNDAREIDIEIMLTVPPQPVVEPNMYDVLCAEIDDEFTSLADEQRAELKRKLIRMRDYTFLNSQPFA